MTLDAAQIAENSYIVKMTYTNWKGETSERSIIPRRIWYGSTEWHPEPQWLLTAFDVEKQADRDFALKDFGTALDAIAAREAAERERDHLQVERHKHQIRAIKAEAEVEALRKRLDEAREAALREAAEIADPLSDVIGAKPFSSIHSALREYRSAILARIDPKPEASHE